MNKHMLLTGSTGFMGQSVLNLLLRNKCEVSTVVRLKQGISPLINEFIIEGISSDNNWANELEGIDVIIHLAGVAHNNSNDIEFINEVNVNGTVNLAQQAIKFGVKRFIFISSIGVLGNNTSKPFDESSIVSPHSHYAASKLKAEEELIKISHETALEVVIIRPVLVYGAGAPGNFGKLVNLVKKMPMLPFALCDNKRSFISIDNLADFIVTCIEHPKAKNEIFCISDGVDVSIKEFTNAIAKGLDTRLLQLPIPNFIFDFLGKLTGKQDQIDQLIGDLQVDSSKARNLLSWTPAYTMAETFSRLTKK